MTVDADDERKMKLHLSERMKAEVRSRICPKCGRLGAVNRLEDETGVTRWCRYKDCDYETYRFWPIPGDK